MESTDKTLTIDNQINELTRVAVFLEELGEEWGLPVSQVYAVNLAMEEALTNIILYGYDDESSHIIKINIHKTGFELSIIIIDDGHEYDPTLNEAPDISLSIGERPVGGLGIFLIKKMMDCVEYQRKENKNYLMLTKNITSSKKDELD